MTIMVLCLNIVSKNNYQIGVKAVSSGFLQTYSKFLQTLLTVAVQKVSQVRR